MRKCAWKVGYTSASIFSRIRTTRIRSVPATRIVTPNEQDIAEEMKRKLYAVKRGRHPGLYSTWLEAEKQVKGFPNAKFKAFATKNEAEDFLGENSKSSVGVGKAKKKLRKIATAPKNSKIKKVEERKGEYHLLQFDGGARGNPGVGGAGVVLLNPEGNVVQKKSVFLGNNVTNNQAEYEALISGLELGEKLGLTKLEIEGDSELIINQVTGLYKVRDASLSKLKDKVSDIANRMEDIIIRHIPRESNKIADQLANQAMDAKENNESCTL